MFFCFFLYLHTVNNRYTDCPHLKLLGYSESASICMMIHVIIGEVTPVSRCDSLTESLAKKNFVPCETGSVAASGSRSNTQGAIINADRCNVSA